MNWDDLRFLVVIAREDSLAAAARDLKVDQTTVARRLRALEEALGTPLFERSAGRWTPTGVGAGVLERAARIEEDVAGIVRMADSGVCAVNGLLRITAVSTLVSEYLGPRLNALHVRHPELSVELIASNANLSVARREVDIAIRLARPESGDFLIRKLADCGFAVYGPQSEVPANAWVGYAEALDDTPEMRWQRARGAIPRLRCNDPRGLAQAIAGGVGQGILPCFVGDAHLGLRRLSGSAPVLFRELWRLIHRDARRQTRVVVAADWLAECFAADAAMFAG